MDSWIFKVARKICVVAFGANIFIHSLIGATVTSGVAKGTLSMGTMLVLLFILSKNDLKHNIKKARKKRKKSAGKEKDKKNA